MPSGPDEPSASPVSCAPERTPPRTDTVIGTSSEWPRSTVHIACGIVHCVDVV